MKVVFPSVFGMRRITLRSLLRSGLAEELCLPVIYTSVALFIRGGGDATIRGEEKGVAENRESVTPLPSISFHRELGCPSSEFLNSFSRTTVCLYYVFPDMLIEHVGCTRTVSVYFPIHLTFLLISFIRIHSSCMRVNKWTYGKTTHFILDRCCGGVTACIGKCWELK